MSTIAYDLNTMEFDTMMDKIKPIMQAIFVINEYHQEYDYLWDDVAEKAGPYLSIVSSSYYDTVGTTSKSEVCWNCFKTLMVHKFTIKFLGRVA